jgi:signal transduction histidine kinase
MPPGAAGVATGPHLVPAGAAHAAGPAPFEGLRLWALVPPDPTALWALPWALGGALAAYGVGVVLGVRAIIASRRAARMQADFVAAVSHEMKTPIASVRAMAERLADGAVAQPERARAYAQRMEAEMTRLGATVRDVLDAARIERGVGVAVRPVPTDPAAVVREAVEAARPALERRGFRVLVEADPSPAPLPLDADAFTHVLNNLLDNAAKFSDEVREIEVRAGPADGVWRLEVLDRGPGVPPAERARIFDRFARGEEAKRRALPGVGLGLHVAREIVRAHGGTIRAEGREGGGARFVVEVPEARR